MSALSQVLRDRKEDLEQEAYEEAFDELLAARRAEWITEFGADNPRFPFRPDGAALHRVVELKLQQGNFDDDD